MRTDGQIIAILNPELVLVRANNESAFKPGKRFRIFEVVSLPSSAPGVDSVQVPKGTLEYEADQEAPGIFLLRVSVQRVTETRRENPLSIAASGLVPWMVEREISSKREVSRSAELDAASSMQISVGPAKTGDYVSAE